MRARALKIREIRPSRGIEGGRALIEGTGFDPEAVADTHVLFGESPARVLLISGSRILAEIPEGASGGTVTVETGDRKSNAYPFRLARKLSGNLNPVDNPVFDADGNLYVTFSGRRDEVVPVSIFRISPDGQMKPYLSNIPNATSMAFDSEGRLYISSRFEGTVYKAGPAADVVVFAKDLGAPTGLAFDGDNNLFVGDRGGRILRISPGGEVGVFAEAPESMVAFHLAFDAHGNLLLANPGMSSSNGVLVFDCKGKVVSAYRGFGRPQGIAADKNDNIYVCEAKAGESGVMRISADREVSTAVTGPVVVGLALDKQGNMAVASQDSVYLVPLAE
jgi:sugar lactone lactonase YvrE